MFHANHIEITVACSTDVGNKCSRLKKRLICSQVKEVTTPPERIPPMSSAQGLLLGRYILKTSRRQPGMWGQVQNEM